MLSCSITPLWSQKQGNLASEYEDAFAQRPPGKIIHSQTCRLAVSDGATESSFAGMWAKQLTRSYCAEPFFTTEQARERANELASKWHDIVFRKPLPWFAEEKARLGAFATFLGLELKAGENGNEHYGRWQAAVVGDSCLFHISSGELLLAVPVNDSDDFDNAPPLIASIPSRNQEVWNRLVLLDGKWSSGDMLLLVTDAAAAWFLKEAESGYAPWNEFAQFTEIPDFQQRFAQWVSLKQRNGDMRNDDVTCLLVNVC